MLLDNAAGAQTTHLDIQTALDPSTVLSLLGSRDPREQAWGAWAAGEGRIYEAVPLLQQMVEARLPGQDWLDDRIPLDVALDALIQLDAVVPSSLLAQVYQLRPASALILLTKAGPDADSFLLELLGREQGIKWFTVANLLLPRRTPGIAYLLLRDLEIEATICVSEEGNRSWFRGSSQSHQIGDGMNRGAPGFPPLAHYYLTTGYQRGNVVAAGGPEPIYYRRQVAPAGGSSGWTEHEIGGPNAEDRLKYLADLVVSEHQVCPEPWESRAVAWRSQEALKEEAETFRQDICWRHFAFIRILVAERLLTEEEASSLPLPKINVEIRDLRSSEQPATPGTLPDD